MMAPEVLIEAKGLAQLYASLRSYASTVAAITAYWGQPEVLAALDAAGIVPPGPSVLHRGRTSAARDIALCDRLSAELAAKVRPGTI